MNEYLAFYTLLIAIVRPAMVATALLSPKFKRVARGMYVAKNA